MNKSTFVCFVIAIICISPGCFDYLVEKQKRITKNYYVSHWSGADGFLIARNTSGSNYELIIPTRVHEVICNDSLIIGKKIDSLRATDTLYFRINTSTERYKNPVDTIGFSDYYYYWSNYKMKLVFTNGRL